MLGWCRSPRSCNEHSFDEVMKPYLEEWNDDDDESIDGCRNFALLHGVQP